MSRTLERLNALLMQLPGIGRKTAQRISFYLLKMKPDEVRALARAMTEAREKVRPCRVCFNLTEDDVCEICADPSRARNLICVVEGPGDVLALERSHSYHGVYHVLGGVLSPLDNVGPDDLRVKELLARIETRESGDDAQPGELIIATNPTTEGEATAAYIARVVPRSPRIAVTRIARGLPIGSDLDLADEVTLARALEGRKELGPG
jgi:recombination protein RecR